MEDLADRLALHRCNLITEQRTSLLVQFGGASAILAANGSELARHGLRKTAIEKLKQPDLPGVERDLAWLEKPGHHIITKEHPAWPSQLDSLDEPPYLLYAIGDLDYLNLPQLAMVGSRNATTAGLNTAREFARHLSDLGLVITSGLALGIDTASHEGALAGLAGTVAVTANGLNKIYPTTNTRLAEAISHKGCILSEAPVGMEPHKGLFPRRNRIISGLSIGILVVEATIKSGSLITARHGMEQGREVFAIPGSIHNPLARGCHRLIKDGAKLVEQAEDIIEELTTLVNLHTSRHTSALIRPAEVDTRQESSLDSSYESLLAHMEYEPVSIDELVDRSGMEVGEIASMLLILELEGHIVSQDGRYTRTG